MGFIGNFVCNGDTVVSVTHRFYWPNCRVPQISPISQRFVCYSTEALKYTQSACFFSIVICQLTNYISIKTRILTFRLQGISNYFMFFSLSTELSVCMLLAYCRPINYAFGSRDVIFLHFGFYACFNSILLLLYDEGRKWLIRNFPKKNPNDPNFFERYTLT